MFDFWYDEILTPAVIEQTLQKHSPLHCQSTEHSFMFFSILGFQWTSIEMSIRHRNLLSFFDCCPFSLDLGFLFFPGFLGLSVILLYVF